MKTVIITLAREQRLNFPIAVPDHWQHHEIAQALYAHATAGAHIAESADWIDWDADTRYFLVAVDHRPVDDKPVFTFPDAPHPQQGELLEEAA